MAHQVVVLGAGYAGLPAAKRLARQVRSGEVEVTLVNAAPRFLERPRLHQAATGQRLRELSLPALLDRSGVTLRLGRVTGIDPGHREVHVDTAEGPQDLAYDTLVYALGSTIDTSRVPGVAEHADSLAEPDAAARLRHRVSRLGPGGSVVVCGGGLTAIETASEIAEARPDLRVGLITRGEPGAWLSQRGRDHLKRTFDRLGVQVRAEADIVEVTAGTVALAHGERVPYDTCVWAAGFTVPPLARDAGLAVNTQGRIVVDDTQRSVSHPEVYAIGDAAAVGGTWGEALAMGCRTGGFTGPHVADVIAARLAGRKPRPFRFRYFHECISLGRRDALIQFLHSDERPRRLVLTGRPAVRYKDFVLDSVAWLFRWPGPYTPQVSRR